MTQPIGGKKGLDVCILRILEEHTDCDHTLTHSEIAKILMKEYGMEAARNAIGRTIALLKEIGYDISTREENGKGTYLRERLFDDMELRVLMDSVLTSRYIPEKNAEQLIEKLGKLSSRHFRGSVPHVKMVKEWNHQHNREFFWNLEALSNAVASRKQVRFRYNRPGADGELHPIREEADVVHPFALLCANGQYYLLASHSEYDNIRHFRVDRITQIQTLDAARRPLKSIPGWERGLDVAKYAREHNLMYGGKAERVTLRVDGRFAGVVLDSFGDAANMTQEKDGSIRVTLYTSAAGMRFWAMQFGGVAEVLAPEGLREAIKEDIRALCGKYGV